jgi:predicted RNA-binding protein with PUA domain
MGMLAQLAFFPSLAYNVTRNYLNAEWWPWYTRIDERVLLGALPFKAGLDEVCTRAQVPGRLSVDCQREHWRCGVSDRGA